MDESRILAMRLQTDPVFHMESVQGAKLLPYQARVARALANHNRVVVSSCHDLGKTFLGGKAVLWLGSSFPSSKGVTTAPSFRQVRHLLWSEINAGFHRSLYPLGGEMLTTRWQIKDDWFCIGYTARDGGAEDANDSAFQGVHSQGRVYFVIDEAAGVKAKIWDQIRAMSTSADVVVFAIGNPTSTSCAFHTACTNGRWHYIKLTCFDSPNLQVNGIVNMTALHEEYDLLMGMNQEQQDERMITRYKITHPYLLTLRWVMETCLEFGLDHPFTVSRAFGDFPSSDPRAMIPAENVEAAIQREIGDEDNPKGSYYGVDVARFGTDKSIIQKITGHRAERPLRLTGKRNTEVAGEVTRILTEDTEARAVAVDTTGLGSGVTDCLVENQKAGLFPKTILILERHNGGAVGDPKSAKKYANFGAKSYGELNEDLRDFLQIPNDPVFMKQLPKRRYELTSQGTIRLESKEDFQTRTGLGSPDEADALALANDARRTSMVRRQFSIVSPDGNTRDSPWRHA